MGYTPIPTVICLLLGAMLHEPASSQGLQRPVLAVPRCLSFARALPAPSSCVGPFCQPCKGSCKMYCGPNETIGTGYCGRGCQCCTRITSSLCLHGASCGLGGKCKSGISCPKGEKPISGTCGHTKTCICCAPDQPLECKPRAQCHASTDYCVEKLGKHGLSRACSKGFAKVLNSCSKGSSTECDCCKKLGCSPTGDRCSGKGDFCIDYSETCPAGHRETQDCGEPHIENGVYYKSAICKCCKPLANECKPRAQCHASTDYCVERIGLHGLSQACSKGFAKVLNSCSKGSTTECDCCKKLGCSPSGDRCSGKGDFCIDYSETCPAGHRETQDCSKPHIENGVYYKSAICKCCKPLANVVQSGGCPLLPSAPPGSSPFDNTNPASGCQGDMDCPGVKKCCAQGVCCARSCMDPCDPSKPWCIGK